MKVLMVSIDLPTFPGTGMATRMYCLAKFLSSTHQFGLVSGCYSPEPDLVANLQPTFRWHDLIDRRLASAQGCSQPRGSRFSLGIDSHSWLRDRLKLSVVNAIDRFKPDVVQIEGLLTCNLLSDLPIHVPVVVDIADIHSRLHWRIAVNSRNPRTVARQLWNWLRFRVLESRVFRSRSVFLAVSELERRHIVRVCPSAQTRLAPNGVDTKYFSASPGGSSERLIFCGNLGYEPNVKAMLEFVHFILPIVREKVPGINLDIVGASPAKELLQLRGHAAVSLHASVPDVRPYIETAGIAIIPLRSGSGTRLKALEAMAMSRPVISTSIGIDGIDARPGQDFLQADSGAEFANAIVKLVSDGGLRTRLAVSGRELVCARYDWNVVAENVEEAYSLALGKVSFR